MDPAYSLFQLPQRACSTPYMVIASYQDALEKEWVSALKSKFEVNVNEIAKSALFEELR